MGWDEHSRRWLDGCHEGAGINSPVTIVEGGRDGACGPWPRVNLEEYTEYVLKKFWREQEWREAAGTMDSGRDFRWAAVAAIADSPLKAIGSVVKDSMYLLTYGLVSKLAVPATGVVTLSVTYYDVLAGSTVLTLTQSLTAAHAVTGGPTPIFLLGGSAVTVSVQNAGAYLTGMYDAFVGLDRIG